MDELYSWGEGISVYQVDWLSKCVGSVEWIWFKMLSIKRGNKIYIWNYFPSDETPIFILKHSPISFSSYYQECWLQTLSTMSFLITSRSLEISWGWTWVKVGSEVVSWCYSKKDHLELDPDVYSDLEPTVIENLQDKIIIDISTSESHVVVLSLVSDQLFIWRTLNRSRTGYDDTIFTPTQMWRIDR